MDVAMIDRVQFEQAGLRICVRTEWLEPLRPLLVAPEQHLRLAAPIKEDRWVRAWRVEFGGKSLFLKSYLNRGATDSIKSLFRPSRAERVWQKGLLAESAGLKVPATFAFMEEVSLGIVRRCYTVQEYIEGGLNLYFFIKAHKEDEPEIIERVAAHIACMHNKGWFHADLKWPNLVLTEDSLYFIDIEAGILKRPLPEAYILKDLARFARDMLTYGAGEASVELFYETYWRLNPIEDSPIALRKRVERERGFRKAQRTGD